MHTHTHTQHHPHTHTHTHTHKEAGVEWMSRTEGSSTQNKRRCVLGPTEAPPPFTMSTVSEELVRHVPDLQVHRRNERTQLDSGRRPSTTRAACWMCCNCVMIPSGHMTSIVLSILERDPPLLLSWKFLIYSPWKFFFLFLGSFSWSDVRSKVRDVVCVRVVKTWGK